MNREELAKLCRSRRRLHIGSVIVGLPLLVGSFNCGYCGKSVEDEVQR